MNTISNKAYNLYWRSEADNVIYIQHLFDIQRRLDISVNIVNVDIGRTGWFLHRASCLRYLIATKQQKNVNAKQK